MPKIPKLLGGFLQQTFSSKFPKVKVIETEYFSASVKRVRFCGAISHLDLKLGQAILILLEDYNYRNYSPSIWNAEHGIFEVIFHIHGHGPASAFVDGLEVGDQLTIGLPRGPELYNRNENYHFFFGDESCLSFFKSLQNQINAKGQNYLGIMELDAISHGVPSVLGLNVDVVPKSTNKASHAILKLNELEAKVWELWRGGTFYLMGNAKSIQNFRKALKDKGVPMKKIITQPFWADGKVGL